MKHSFRWLALGLASTILFTACGTASVTNAKEAVTEASSQKVKDSPGENFSITERYSDFIGTDDAPPIMPLTEWEAPITTICTDEDGAYPDPLCGEVVLQDLTDNITYNLADVFPDDFTVYRGHNYTVCLYLHSDGDPIKNIQVVAQLPDSTANSRTNCIRFIASDSETTQPLLSARVYLQTDDGDDFTVRPLVTDSAINYEGIFIGDIGNEPTDIGFDFCVQ